LSQNILKWNSSVISGRAILGGKETTGTVGKGGERGSEPHGNKRTILRLPILSAKGWRGRHNTDERGKRRWGMNTHESGNTIQFFLGETRTGKSGNCFLV